MFKLIAGGYCNDINFKKLKKLGRVLKMNESYLSEKGKDISVNYLKSFIIYMHFEVYYFKVFAGLDKQGPSVEVERKESVRFKLGRFLKGLWRWSRRGSRSRWFERKSLDMLVLI